jgi:hypothetical protein
MDLLNRPPAEEAAYCQTLAGHLPELQRGQGSWRTTETLCEEAANAARLLAGATTTVPPCIVLMRATQGSGKTDASNALAREDRRLQRFG